MIGKLGVQFVEDFKGVLIEPKSYYSRLNDEPGYKDAIVKMLYYFAIPFILQLILNFVRMAKSDTLASILGYVIAYPVVVIVSFFISIPIFVILAKLAGGRISYAKSAKAVSAISAFSATASVAILFSSIFGFLGMLVSFALLAGILYVTYNALIHAAASKPKRTILIIAVFGIVSVLSMIISLVSILFSGKMQKAMLENMESAQKISAEYEKIKTNQENEQIADTENSPDTGPSKMNQNEYFKVMQEYQVAIQTGDKEKAEELLKKISKIYQDQ